MNFAYDVLSLDVLSDAISNVVDAVLCFSGDVTVNLLNELAVGVGI